jgi:hypothetical protein
MDLIPLRFLRRSAHVAATLALNGCGGTSQPAAPDGGIKDAAASDVPDASLDVVDAPTDHVAVDAPPEASTSSDGTPMYASSCTPLSNQTGTAIDTSHGRLDGYLSYVIPIGGPHECNGDESHVHLQIRTDGSIYDVAVDTGRFMGDVLFYEADMTIPDGAWAEGWHGTDALTYTSLGVHSTQFAPQDPTTLGEKLQTELAGVNHISVFGTGYSQENGCHDVHFESGNGRDGAIVLEPLSPTPHWLFFRFSTDTF